MDLPAGVLIVPAAGRGARLGGSAPKVLAPVGGRPMIDWLLDLYDPYVAHVVLVVHPAAREVVAQYLSRRTRVIELVEQREPTGMLDAILTPSALIERWQPAWVWVTWCDQIAVHPRTVARLAETPVTGAAPLVLPTVRRHAPYIHLERDGAGRIVRVRHRREGDRLPDPGESDVGLFSLSREAYLRELPAFAAEVTRGAGTGERNFLPFIPWLAARARVETFPALDEMESVGINTPEERAQVERYLAERSRT
jgi:bifunctional UDP-N-acetylglucosamine pyrophosphorylase / glucosamine-1-phosphate N-acetyltransferase